MQRWRESVFRSATENWTDALEWSDLKLPDPRDTTKKVKPVDTIIGEMYVHFGGY
jgi:hypothetical protein